MKKVFILFILLLIINLLITDLILKRANTLEHNGKWIATKHNLEMSVFGADNFFINTQALADQRLNLAAWHGFQEVIYYEKVNPSLLELDLWLNNSYVYIIFNKSDSSFSSYRISNNPSFPSAFVTATTDGEFLSSQQFAVNTLVNNDHIPIKILFDKKSSFVELFINNEKVASNSIDVLENQLVGFRGSMNSTYIDNVRIYQNDPSVIIVEDFTNRKNTIYILGGICLIEILFLCILFVYFRITSFTYKKWNILLVCCFWIIVFLIPFRLYIFTQLKNYPDPSFKLPFFTSVKDTEVTWINNEAESITNELLLSHKIGSESGVYKIMFIGSSQTWGAGASTKSNIFPIRIENNLNNHNKEICIDSNINKFNVINTGVSGTDSWILLEYYRNKWIQFDPNMVIINLSNNDTVNNADPDVFYQNIEEIIKLNRSRNIQTMLVLEANSIERSPDRLLLHDELITLGTIYNIPVLDLHSYLKLKNETGILWWDEVHMTDYGQKLTSDYITSQLLTGCE